MYFFPHIVKNMQNETLKGYVCQRLLELESGSSSILIQDVLAHGISTSKRSVLRALNDLFGVSPITDITSLVNGQDRELVASVTEATVNHLGKNRNSRLVFLTQVKVSKRNFFLANDRRGMRWWVTVSDNSAQSLVTALLQLRNLVGRDIAAIPHRQAHLSLAGITPPQGVTIVDWAHPPLSYLPPDPPREKLATLAHRHLNALEAESIRIIREAVAVSQKPAMLFSMGKDSMVMLTLARKAFWPDPVPFPLVMIDTRWKFQEMYRFREWIESNPDLDVVVHTNPDAVRDDINPFDHGSAHHTDVTKTQALRQILDQNRFDFVFGGARRDEEKSRAKERVFSVRSSNHGWDPKNQRPELWNLYNTRLAADQSMRVFPISNWTELDVWRYVERENIPIVPLYLSKVRPFVERNGSLIMVDDHRFRLEPNEKIRFEPIRFRTLGCYPLTGGVISRAAKVSDIIAELERSRVSERSSRVIDFDAGASMEQKKKEGYF